MTVFIVIHYMRLAEHDQALAGRIDSCLFADFYNTDYRVFLSKIAIAAFNSISAIRISMLHSAVTTTSAACPALFPLRSAILASRKYHADRDKAPLIKSGAKALTVED
jgi:hypothetical protein